MRPAPETLTTPVRFLPPSLWLDAWVVLMLMMPVLTTFYPPESYFFTGYSIAEQSFEPSAIMPVLLLAMSASQALVWLLLARVRRPRLSVLALLYLATVATSLAQSPAFAEALNRWLRLLPLTGFAMLAAQIYPMRRMIRLFLVAFLLSALCSLVMVAFFPVLGLAHMGGPYETSWRGAIGHKNTAGFVYGLGGLIAGLAYIDRLADRRLALATGLLCALIAVKSDSATALVAGASALFLTLALRGAALLPGTVRLLLLGAFSGLLLSALMLALSMPDLLAAMVGRDLTLTGRTLIWSEVWTLIEARPLSGWGYAFWQIDTPERAHIFKVIAYVASHAHNSWLDLWLQVGLFGMIVVGLDLLRSIATGLIRLARADAVATASIPFAVSVVLLVRSGSEVQFSEPNVNGLFWLIWASLALRLRDGIAARPAPSVARARHFT
ncbi:O-antigen ligase family protein [Sphingomonas morindae]|uniref:O-antigen ligase family protein n=1 Tax=Sphingomonas morindae TaxID=1541170 RepID=A0ABY4X6B7_9SPHN|nr:O-antigen ligase family protein [Sphingomonas morindae]USI72464.1 O-antigen ligase family protein [Sphingomonas morindae]